MPLRRCLRADGVARWRVRVQIVFKKNPKGGYYGDD